MLVDGEKRGDLEGSSVLVEEDVEEVEEEDTWDEARRAA